MSLLILSSPTQIIPRSTSLLPKLHAETKLLALRYGPWRPPYLMRATLPSEEGHCQDKPTAPSHQPSTQHPQVQTLYSYTAVECDWDRSLYTFTDPSNSSLITNWQNRTAKIMSNSWWCNCSDSCSFKHPNMPQCYGYPLSQSPFGLDLLGWSANFIYHRERCRLTRWRATLLSIIRNNHFSSNFSAHSKGINTNIWLFRPLLWRTNNWTKFHLDPSLWEKAKSYF